MAPGIPLNISIIFSPKAAEKAVQGEIVFLTYAPETSKYFQFIIPLLCIPHSDLVIVLPKSIDFGSLPIWVARRMEDELKQKKIYVRKQDLVNKWLRFSLLLQVKNAGDVACTVNVRKYKNPLEEFGEDSENEPDRSAFIFDNYSLNIDAKCISQLTVCFKNIDHVGDYQEKYVLDIFQENDGESQLLSCEVQNIYLIFLP